MTVTLVNDGDRKQLYDWSLGEELEEEEGSVAF